MVTKSIRLSTEEADSVREFVDLTGEVEASVLKRAMLRGLRELRIEQAILQYMQNGDSYEAAQIAGVPRARFLNVLVERGVALLGGASTIREEVSFLADAFGAEGLRVAAAQDASTADP